MVRSDEDRLANKGSMLLFLDVDEMMDPMFELSDEHFDLFATDFPEVCCSSSSDVNDSIEKSSTKEISAKLVVKPMDRKRRRILFGLDGNKPNVSRRPPSATLYAFPNFDKCDSLLYFPNTFTRLVNSGDMKGVSKLIATHMSKGCDIRGCFNPDWGMDSKSMIKFQEIMNEFYPDTIMCVHSTKVIGNEIRALVYLKATESKILHEYVYNSKLADHPLFRRMFHKMSYQDSLRFKINMCSDLGEEAKQKLLDLAESGVDCVLYLQNEFVLTFDDITKKITSMVVTGKLTSMRAKGPTPK